MQQFVYFWMTLIKVTRFNMLVKNHDKIIYLNLLIFFFLVLPGFKQLPAATQAAANRHPSTEQPGGAFPLA